MTHESEKLIYDPKRLAVALICIADAWDNASIARATGLEAAEVSRLRVELAQAVAKAMKSESCSK